MKLLVTLFLLLTPLAVQAQTRLTVTVGDPQEQTLGPDLLRRTHLVNMVHQAYIKRTEAAGMSGTQIRLVPTGIELNFARKWEAGFIRAILMAPGFIEVRGHTPVAMDWVQNAALLPEGVEIRGTSEPYLWSANRNLLDQVVQNTSNDQIKIGVGRVQDGWRTWTGSQLLGTAHDVSHARRDRSANGGHFVSIRFRTSMVDRLATPGFLDVRGWLIILDGEVLGHVSSTALSNGVIEVSAPASLSPEQQRLWTSQVAGRLAAPLPVPVAILSE